MATDPRLAERIISTPEEHDAAWVGGPPPKNSVVVVDYDPQWPALYTREAQRIRSLLFIQEYAQAKDPIIDDIYARAFAEYDGG